MRKIYLLVLAFISGLTIMSVEITASRLIAPFFGTSIFVWTNIIGIIMLALSVGYYIGGKLADKKPYLDYILKKILVACLILVFVPFIIQPIVNFIIDNIISFKAASVIIFVGSLITVSLLFTVPIVILGMVSPFIIKLLALEDKNIGNDAGMVFSISTLGSILGTFLPVLVFIPLFGSKKTIIILTLFLVLTALLGLLKTRYKYLIFIILLPCFFYNFSYTKNAEGKVFETESLYQYLMVQDSDDFRSLLINEGLGVSSLKNLDENKVLTGYYYDYYNIVPVLSGDYTQDILILGLATGTISSQLNNYFTKNFDLKIDGVEIDEKIIDIGKEYFDLENDSLQIYNMDARNYLRLNTKKYNSIIIDAYSVQNYIPFHLATVEFFDQVSNSLKPNGIMAMNVNATSVDSQLLRTITNTLSKEFTHIYLLKTNDDYFNFVVIASNNKVNWEELNTNKYPELKNIFDYSLANNKRIDYYPLYDYFTDDKSGIEFMTEKMIINYMFENLK